MSDVVEYQRERGVIPQDTDPYLSIALAGVGSCQHIGETRWLRLPNGEAHGPFTVVDCSAAQDAERHQRDGKCAEVSFEWAMDHSLPIGNGRYRVPLDDRLNGVYLYSLVGGPKLGCSHASLPPFVSPG